MHWLYFIFSTIGEKWLEHCNFLNETVHVCKWSCEWPFEDNPTLETYIEAGGTSLEKMGVECDSPNGNVRSMEFGKRGGRLSGSLSGKNFVVGARLTP